MTIINNNDDDNNNDSNDDDNNNDNKIIILITGNNAVLVLHKNFFYNNLVNLNDCLKVVIEYKFINNFISHRMATWTYSCRRFNTIWHIISKRVALHPFRDFQDEINKIAILIRSFIHICKHACIARMAKKLKTHKFVIPFYVN